MFFSVLNQDINKALANLGYETPTPIQAKAIPAILAGKDIVASSQTGSGKTAAFILPALHHLSLQPLNRQTKILILTPTRELASQIMQAARNYGKFLKSIRIISLVGGMSYGPQINELNKGADIIVATPGRLIDHINTRRVDLSHVEMFVLDEADRMLDMGFIDDVEYIAKLLPIDRQTLLFSATVDKSLAHVVRHLLKNPLRIDLSQEKLSIPKIKQQLYKTDNIQHKTRLLKQLLKNIYKAIIFTATKVHADKLADQLNEAGYRAAALHGDLRQNVRNRRIDELKRNKIHFLVATDVAARGIDITDVSHVINFDIPRDCEDYVHRIGRTGRAGKEGIAISFVLPSEKRQLSNIEHFIKQKLSLIEAKSLIGEYEKDSHANDSRDHGYADLKKSKKRVENNFRQDNRKAHRSSSQKTKKEGDGKRRRFKDVRPARFDRDDKERHHPKSKKSAYSAAHEKKHHKKEKFITKKNKEGEHASFSRPRKKAKSDYQSQSRQKDYQEKRNTNDKDQHRSIRKEKDVKKNYNSKPNYARKKRSSRNADD